MGKMSKEECDVVIRALSMTLSALLDQEEDEKRVTEMVQESIQKTVEKYDMPDEDKVQFAYFMGNTLGGLRYHKWLIKQGWTPPISPEVQKSIEESGGGWVS